MLFPGGIILLTNQRGKLMQLQPHFQPNVSLMNIEYLVLSIQSNPGRSQRWHLRRLHIYKHGVEDYHKGGYCNGYFQHKTYRNVLWTDVAAKEVEYSAFAPADRQWPPHKSKCAQMHLTRKGWHRANTIRNKLGLKHLVWGTQPLPERGAIKIYQTAAVE